MSSETPPPKTMQPIKNPSTASSLPPRQNTRRLPTKYLVGSPTSWAQQTTRLLLLAMALCWIGLPNVVYAQNSAHCRQLLKKHQYKSAIICFQKLFRAYPKKRSYLRNQAIIFRMWAQSKRAQHPAAACYLLKRAIQTYKQYQRISSGVDQLEVATRITRLQKMQGLAGLSVASFPEDATLEITAYRFKKKLRAPVIFTGLCPGKYTIRLTRKDYFPLTKVVVLKPNRPTVRVFRLRPTLAALKLICPGEVRIQLGEKGCQHWTRCRKKQPNACVQLARQYRKKGDLLASANYLAMACQAGKAPRCYEAGMAYLTTGRLKPAHRYLKYACRRKQANACFYIAEIYAGHVRPATQIRSKQRRCKEAIPYYDRACRLGLDKACTMACNTISVTAPIAIHATLHVGSLLSALTLGLVSSQSGYNTALNKSAAILAWGGLTLGLMSVYVPLWKKQMETHSLGWMLASTSSLALPLGAAALMFLSSTQNNADNAFYQDWAIGILVLAFPVHLMWTLYGWARYITHNRLIKDSNLDAKLNKVRVSFLPLLLRDGAGLALAGAF